MLAVASFAGRVTEAGGDDDVHWEPHEFSRERGEVIEFSLSRSPLNDNVFILEVSKLTQPSPECLVARPVSGKG